jgi:hypothetical protein
MYVLYYASMFRCWHLVWILVRTDHHSLGVGCHTLLGECRHGSVSFRLGCHFTSPSTTICCRDHHRQPATTAPPCHRWTSLARAVSIYPLAWWFLASLTLPDASAPCRRCSTRRPRRLPSTGRPPPVTPPRGPCMWWPHCERTRRARPMPCCGPQPRLGQAVHAKRWAKSDPTLFRVYLFPEYVFQCKISRNLFKFLKYIENKIKIKKLKINFLIILSRRSRQ